MTRPAVRVVHSAARFLREEYGPTVTEYAVMIALIILVSVAAISSLGTKVDWTYQTLKDNVPSGS